MTSFRLYTNTKAIMWVTIGTALFSLIFASGKFADGTATPFQILFLRYIGGLATLLLAVTARRERLPAYRSAKPLSHFMRAIFGASGGGALIYASTNMPIVDATAIGLLYVVFVIPLGVLVLKEQLTSRHLGAVAVCCAGAAVVMASRGAFTGFHLAYVFPAGIAVLGAALLAVEGLIIKMLSNSDRAMTVLLYVNAFGILLMAGPAATQWVPLSIESAMSFLLLGPIAVTAQYCIVQGYRLASLSIVGPVDYTWLIFAGLIGFLFFGEKPTLGVAAGSAIIALGGIMLAIIKPPACERESLSPD
ncbi:DMT family transporter [Agrobacterium vitis]|uniref:DMT family transporter n=1 Tax=Rhizobium/Agrobacterium group TaxID=227290 RepID=UPI0012E7CAA7|nr:MULTISPECIES: DMT family transporter [Rhizobium/Agrobacterium group]MCF1450654.1 DMT family transporter [Allorhizobium ampelinum]MVA72103.1 EamA family transporter [Agrobacterium vitis]